MAAVGSGVVALVAVGGDVSSPGSHRCCRDRGGQCKWRGSGQGGGHVPGGEQDLLLPSPALPVDWTLPCREKAWAPQGGCAPRAAWPHCPQQSCLPCDPRGGLPARCHWPGEEQTGPPGSPAPPPNAPPLPTTHLHVQTGPAGRLRLASAPQLGLRTPRLVPRGSRPGALKGGAVPGRTPLRLAPVRCLLDPSRRWQRREPPSPGAPRGACFCPAPSGQKHPPSVLPVSPLEPAAGAGAALRKGLPRGLGLRSLVSVSALSPPGWPAGARCRCRSGVRRRRGGESRVRGGEGSPGRLGGAEGR